MGKFYFGDILFDKRLELYYLVIEDCFIEMGNNNRFTFKEQDLKTFKRLGHYSEVSEQCPEWDDEFLSYFSEELQD